MAFAYATTNLLSGLAAGSFTFSTGAGPADATRLYLNDGKMDAQYSATAGTTAETIQIDLGSARAVSGIAILNHNLAALGGGTITITAAASSDFLTSPVTPKATTTVNATAPKHKDTVLQFASTTKRYWRIAFTHVGSTALKLGELFFYAASTSLSRDQADGSGESERLVVADVRMQQGSVRGIFFGGPIRRKRLRTADWTTTQRDQALTLWRAVLGPVSPFLWIESYEATSTAAAVAQQDCIYGRLQLPEFEWSWVNFDITQIPELLIESEGRERGA